MNDEMAGRDRPFTCSGPLLRQQADLEHDCFHMLTPLFQLDFVQIGRNDNRLGGDDALESRALPDKLRNTSGEMLC